VTHASPGQGRGLGKGGAGGAAGQGAPLPQRMSPGQAAKTAGQVPSVDAHGPRTGLSRARGGSPGRGGFAPRGGRGQGRGSHLAAGSVQAQQAAEDAQHKAPTGVARGRGGPGVGRGRGRGHGSLRANSGALVVK
jgi:hypothetical protein